MSQLGLGVMIDYLKGNEDTVNAVKQSLGKRIKGIKLDEDKNELIFTFNDKTKLIIWDNGQSCCEDRYMRTDDKLKEFINAKLIGLEIKDGPSQDDDRGCHEIQLLDVKTSKGIFQMANHNKHDGYYGGFSLNARMELVN